MKIGKTQDIQATYHFGQEVDFGRAASDYRNYRAGFPQRFFDNLQERGLVFPGGKALDVGTGSGTVARGLAARGMQVDATDPAETLLTEARSIDADCGLSVSYSIGRAEHVDFPTEHFDLVTAGQCWHWFDRAVAAKEIYRVTRQSGAVVVAHLDWLPIKGNVVAVTEDQILSYNPSWSMGGGTGIYPQWLTDLNEAGFTQLQTFSFDLAIPYTHEAWRGRIRASAGVKASLDAERTKKFDQELASRLAKEYPEDPLLVPHRVWAVTGRKAKIQ